MDNYLLQEFEEPLAEQPAPEQPKRKRRRRLRFKDVLIILVPAVAVTVAVITLLGTVEKASDYQVEAPASQYYADSSFEVAEGSVLSKTDSGSVVAGKDGEKSTVSNLPIYYDDTAKMVLPRDMVYYDPRKCEYGRLNAFTEISLKGSTVTARTEDASTVLSGGFIYDGENLYIFLEPMILKYNSYEIALPALSYVEAEYGGLVMSFDYGAKECFYEAPKGTVSVYPEDNKDYTLSLINDSFVNYAGKKMLLFTRPDLLDPIV